jgi:hypothetical protein
MNGLMEIIENHEIIQIFESCTIIRTQGLISEKMTTCKFLIRNDTQKLDDRMRMIIENF